MAMDDAVGAMWESGGADSPASAPSAAGAVELIESFDGRRLNVEAVFEPVIDLRRMAAVGYHVAARVTLAATGEPLDAPARMGLLASDMERIDLVALDRALDRLPTAEDAGQGRASTSALIVSVSYFTASTQRSRTRFLDRAGPRRDRVRTSVIWGLTDVPEGAPHGRLTEVSALLKPFGRAVFAATRLGGAVQQSARSAGIAGLVIDPEEALGASDDMALWLLQAGKLAHRAAPALIAAGLASQDLLPMAAAAGFTHATLRKDVVWLAA